MVSADDFLDSPDAPAADGFLDGKSGRSAADDFLDAEPRNAALRTLDTLANASGKVTEAVKAGAEGAVTNFGPALVKKAVDFNKLGASAAGLAFPQYAPVIEAARGPLIDQPEAYIQKGQEALADQKEGQPYWKQLATDVGAGLGALPAAGLDVAAGKGLGLGAGLSGATAAKQALPLGMAFFGAGEGGAEGAAKGYLEGLAMHGAGEIGQGLSVVPRVGAQMGAQGVVGAGLNSADAFLDGRVPTTEETLHAGATGAAIGLPFGLAPGKMGVGREEPKVFAPDRPKDPATAGFWSRVNGTLSAAPERRLTSDELEMEAQTSPALKAFVATHDALVNNGRLDLAGKLSIADLSRGDDAAPSMALNLSGLSPEDRNQVYALAAKNGLSNNVEGQQGRLVFTGEGAGFAPVVTPDRPTNLLDGSALPIPKPQAPAESGASSLTDRIIQAESGGNSNATAGTSSARGLGQFVEGTRNAILQRYGVDAWSKDPAEQRRATELLIGENRDALRSALGREPSDGEIYMANFLGAGGAKPFLRAMADNPGDAAANHVSPAAAQANKSIFYGKDGTPRTLAEVYGMMAGKVGDGGTSGQPAVRPELVALRQDMEQRAPTGTPTFEGTDAASINRRLDLLNPARDEQTRQLRTDILARDEEARLADQRRLAESPFPVTMEDMDQAPRPAIAADPVGAAPFEQRLGGPEPRVEPVRDVQPEPRPYIDAQVQAMTDPRSTKRAVLVTPGSPFPADLPKGTKAFLTRHGTVLTSDPELARRLPYDATDQQMGAAVLNWEGGRPATVKGGEVVRALDANGTPVGEVHVAREDIPKALAAMRGLSPVDKAVRVPLKKALADRERGMAQQAKQISTLEAGIDKLTKRLAVTREPQARAKFENERQALEFQLRDLRGETAPVLTPEEQARAQAVRQRPALPQGQGFDLVGKPQDYTRSENASLEPYAREALARGEVPSARDMAEFDAGGGRTEAEIVAEHQRRALQDYDGKQNSALWKFLKGRLNAKSVSDQYGKAALEDLRSKAPRSIFAANGDGMPFDRLEQEARSQGHIAKDADLVDTLLGNVTNKEQAARDRVAGQGERRDFRPVEPTGPNPEADGVRPLNSDGTPRAADEPYYRQSPGQPKYGKITAEAARESLSKTPYTSAEVLNSPADMPPGGLRDYVFRNGGSGVKGLYDPKTGRSYVFSGNHTNMADLLVTARDELFHRGTFRWAEEMAAKHPEAGPAFKQLNRFMRDVTVAKRETINAWLEKNGYGDLKGTHYGANEWLTHAASREAPKWYDRYVAAAVKAFRSIGQALGFDLKVTDAEIRDWSRKVEDTIGQEARLMGAENPEALFRKAAEEPTFTEYGLPNETIREWIVRKMQDRMNRLAKTVDVLGKRAGEPLPDHVDAALRENLYQGRTEERLRQFEADHVKPLVESVKAAGVSLGDVEDALYAMHAKRRNMVIAERTKGENAAGSGITDAQADEIMAGLRESGKLEKIYPIVRRVWNINKARLALLKSSGLESEETLKLWRETYGENYVPLKSSGDDARSSLIRTIMGEGESQRMRTGRGYDIRGKESRHATGRHTEAGNILANVLAQYEETAIRAEKNRVGQSFLRMAVDNPDPKLWEVDKTPPKPTFNVKTGEVEVKRDPRYKLADNVFSVKVDGQEHLVTIKDDVLAGAMKNLGAEKSNMALRVLGHYNRAMSLINTSLDPEFVVSNFLRDLQTANLNLTAEKKTGLAKQITKDTFSGAPIKGIYRALREKDSAAGDEWSQWFDRYRQSGGKIGFFGLRSVEDQAKRLEGMLSEANGGAWASTKQGIRSVLDYIGDVNGAVENGLRLAAFRRSVEAGMSEERAANLAKELTVNFNKRGEASTTLNALYLFANASVQGNARILKALVTSKRGAYLAGSVIAGSVALAALNRQAGGTDTDGQDFYDKIDDSVKSRNLVLMKWWKDDGSYMTLPLPYGYNVLKVVGDQIESMALGKQSPIGAAGKATAAFIDAFNPLGSAGTLIGAITPTIGRPIAEISTNTDFGGNPIKPEQSKFGPKKPESQLAWSTVSKPAKWIAEELNKLTGGNEFEPGKIDVSPEVLEHLWSTYTGGVARFLNRAVNLGMNAYDGTAPATKDIPFARRLMGEQSPYVTPKQFREATDIIQRKQAAYMAYRETDPEQAKGYRQDNLEELAMVPKLKDAEKALKPLVAKRNEIKVTDASDAEKALLLKPVEDQMATIQKAFLRDYLERDASPQDIQKADKTFTLKQAQDERAQILADYREAIQGGDTERADAIAAQARQQYNDKVRAQKLPTPLIRGSSLREIRRSIRRGPGKSARRVERYLNTFDEEDNEE